MSQKTLDKGENKGLVNRKTKGVSGRGALKFKNCQIPQVKEQARQGICGQNQR